MYKNSKNKLIIYQQCYVGKYSSASAAALAFYGTWPCAVVVSYMCYAPLKIFEWCSAMCFIFGIPVPLLIVSVHPLSNPVQ